MNKNILVWILGGLLVLAFGYIGVDKYSDMRSEELSVYYEAGANVGYQQAVLDIASRAVTCNAVPLNVGENQTLEIIATACLQQG